MQNYHGVQGWHDTHGCYALGRRLNTSLATRIERHSTAGMAGAVIDMLVLARCQVCVQHTTFVCLSSTLRLTYDSWTDRCACGESPVVVHVACGVSDGRRPFQSVRCDRICGVSSSCGNHYETWLIDATMLDITHHQQANVLKGDCIVQCTCYISMVFCVAQA